MGFFSVLNLCARTLPLSCGKGRGWSCSIMQTAVLRLWVYSKWVYDTLYKPTITVSTYRKSCVCIVRTGKGGSLLDATASRNLRYVSNGIPLFCVHILWSTRKSITITCRNIFLIVYRLKLLICKLRRRGTSSSYKKSTCLVHFVKNFTRNSLIVVSSIPSTLIKREKHFWGLNLVKYNTSNNLKLTVLVHSFTNVAWARGT